MLQAKLIAPQEISLEEVEIPSLEDDQVLIQVKVCGICGSDIHAYKGKHPFVHPPIVLGHEFSGEIVETGPRIKDFRKGDRVAVEPNIVCGRCFNCRHGRYNICNQLKVIGCVGYNGAFAEYIAVPAEKVFKLPQDLSYEEAALIEPTAVAVHVVRRSGQKIGDRIVILGAGSIGLLVMQVAKETGAGEAIITDLLDYRLEKALELEADEAINPGLKEPVKLIRQKYGEERVDLIYDCVGVETTISQAIQIARKGTKIMIVGVPEGEMKVNLAYVQDRELELVGSLMYTRDDFTTAMGLIEKRRIKVKPLITHRFKLKDIGEAFSMITETKEEWLKVLIET